MIKCCVQINTFFIHLVLIPHWGQSILEELCCSSRSIKYHHCWYPGSPYCKQCAEMVLSNDYEDQWVYVFHSYSMRKYCNELCLPLAVLTHWGRVTHICVSKLTIIGSDNALLSGRRQAIIWTNAGILLIRTLGTNFSEILGEIHSFSISFSKMHLQMSSAKWRLFGLGLNELTPHCARSEPALIRCWQIALILAELWHIAACLHRHAVCIFT